MRLDPLSGSRKRLFVWTKTYASGDPVPVPHNVGTAEHHAHLLAFDAADIGTSAFSDTIVGTVLTQPSVTPPAEATLLDIWATNNNVAYTGPNEDAVVAGTVTNTIGARTVSAVRGVPAGATTGDAIDHNASIVFMLSIEIPN